MNWRSLALAFAFLGAFAPQLSAQPQPPVAQPATTGAPALTATDVSAWLDGYLPYALHQADIAGAVVVVTKDGQLLFHKGYGYADIGRRRPMDPATTLVRPQSVSKLFTWTAVMQLVSAGKLDLDADVNRYLDFRIPPYRGAPVTLRDLLTHTAGFEEQEKGSNPTDPARVPALGDFIRAHLPTRIFPPGEVVAYSNYGAALAGRIVERVSGEPYATYVQRHILDPLGMAHSTFHQPLPPSLARDMAIAYDQASGSAQPFEYDADSPAGALSATADDVGRFAIMHLANGRFGAVQVLSPTAAAQMHATAFRTLPQMKGMALGFFEEDRNGRRVLGHSGDGAGFHSALYLIMDENVGVFISLNSSGTDSATEAIRLELLSRFMDRYYPAPNPEPPRLATALADGRTVAGIYGLSRRGETTVLAGLNLLQQLDVSEDAHGDLSLPLLDGLLDSPPRTWREIAPFVWQESDGRSRLAAVVKDGRVVTLTTDAIDAGAVLQPVPLGLRKDWLWPALGASLAVLAATFVLWPVNALVRRRYGAPFQLSGRQAVLHRLVRLAAGLQLVFIGGWAALLAATQGSPAPDTSLDGWMRLFQAVGALCVLGAVAAVVNAALIAADRSRGWWSKLSSVAIALAMAIVVWTMFVVRVFAVSLNY